MPTVFSVRGGRSTRPAMAAGVLSLVFAFVEHARAGEPVVDGGSPLERTIPSFDTRVRITSAPWPRKISMICQEARIPCGLEEAPDDPVHGIEESYDHEERLPSIPDPHATVRQLLDVILAKHPHYRWEFQDGFLLIRPKPGKEHRRLWKALLSRRLDRFRYSNEPAAGLLFDACLKTGVMKMPGPREIQAFGTLPKTGRVSVDLENVTVREALAAIARADGQLGWKFAYDPGAKGFALRVVTWERAPDISPYWW